MSTALPRVGNVPEMVSPTPDWNYFGAFRSINTTTSKLADELAEVAFANERTRNGDFDLDEELAIETKNQFLAQHGPCYQYVLQVTHTGGRDWTILVGLDYPCA